MKNYFAAILANGWRTIKGNVLVLSAFYCLFKPSVSTRRNIINFAFSTLTVPLFFLYFFCFLIVGSCAKEEVPERSRIQTLAIEIPALGAAVLRGTITDLGTDAGIDHGFIYGYSPDLPSGAHTSVSLGGNIKLGEFQANIENFVPASELWREPMIYARAFITDRQGTRYGSTMSAKIPIPTMVGIYPSMGQVGDTVRLSGKFHSADAKQSSVTFSNTLASIVHISDTSISVIVPEDIPAYHGWTVDVKANIGGMSTTIQHGFTVLAKFSDFFPKTGPVGTPIQFTGKNLHNYPSMNLLSFAMGGDGVPINWDGVFYVPFTVQERSKITAIINGRPYEFPDQFVVTPPEIVSFNQSTAFSGRTVSLKVKGMASFSKTSPSGARPQVRVGTGSFQDLMWEPDNVFFEVPLATPEGDHTVYIKVGPHLLSSKEKLKIIGYSATRFSPSTAFPGNTIKIEGRFEAGQHYRVLVGNTVVDGYATSSTVLTTTVPSGLSGKVNIIVETPVKRILVPGELSIMAPTFASFSPNSGVPGTEITILGTGFNVENGWTAVDFGSVTVIPISVSEKMIKVAVPSNVPPGAMKLSVLTNGQRVTHNTNFVLTN